MSQDNRFSAPYDRGKDIRRADFLRRSRRRKRAYRLALLTSLVIAFVLYVGAADNFSAAELNRLTPLWVFPLLFGAHGLIVEELLRIVADGRAADLAGAARHWNRSHGRAGLVGVILLLPFALFRYTRYQSPWLATFLAAVFWSLPVVVLFDLLFPWLSN